MPNKNNVSNSKLASIGNFTKNAVENFEENIVSQKNYLEKVNSHENIHKKTNN